MTKKTNIQKIVCTWLLYTGLCTPAAAQSLSLAECQRLAGVHYPQTKQYALIERSAQFSIDNIAKSWIPQANLIAQASYQNIVLEFPDMGQPFKMDPLRKDQYKAGAEINQLIYDGGASRQQRAIAIADRDLQQAQLTQSLYPLRERIDQLYFGILLLQDNLKQNALLQEDIQTGIRQASAALENGTVFRSAVDELKASALSAEQQRILLLSNRDAYLQMLGTFIQQSLDSTTLLEKPTTISVSDSIARPELKVFALQQQLTELQEKQLQSRNLPTVSAFFNAYYGAPTFNMVDNDFGFFWMGGIRFGWNIGRNYTAKNDRAILDLKKQQTSVAQESFLFNTRLDQTLDNSQIRQYRQQVAKDQEIIALRESVKKAAAAQLENGVITPHDYLVQVNEDNQARLSLSLHQVYLLKANYQLAYHTGSPISIP